MTYNNRSRCFAIVGLLFCCAHPSAGQVGQTEITKWQSGRNGAVSLTYDDGSINQFRVAIPIMDSFGFPATFFIITGQIPGSQYHGTFIGRPIKTIIEETVTVPTNKDNFFERASALPFLGYQGTGDYHARAGETYDEEKNYAKAYAIVDDAYAKVRQGALKPVAPREASTNREGGITWEELRALSKHGHEFASHTVTHPRVAALDDANLIYELEKSRQEILDQLGFKHTFSVECPYGSEDSRGVAFALQRYQTARNRIPDSFVEDLDRDSTEDPGNLQERLCPLAAWGADKNDNGTDQVMGGYGRYPQQHLAGFGFSRSRWHRLGTQNTRGNKRIPRIHQVQGSFFVDRHISRCDQIHAGTSAWRGPFIPGWQRTFSGFARRSD